MQLEISKSSLHCKLRSKVQKVLKSKHLWHFICMESTTGQFYLFRYIISALGSVLKENFPFKMNSLWHKFPDDFHVGIIEASIWEQIQHGGFNCRFRIVFHLVDKSYLKLCHRAWYIQENKYVLEQYGEENKYLCNSTFNLKI